MSSRPVLLKRVIFSKIVCTHRGGWREAPNQPLNLSQHVLELIPVSFEAFAQGHNLCIAASFWRRKRYRGQVRIPLVFVERCDVHRRDGAVLAEIGAPRRLTLAALRAARSCHLSIIDRASNSAFSPRLRQPGDPGPLKEVLALGSNRGDSY